MYKFIALSLLASAQAFTRTAYDVLPPKPYKAPVVEKVEVEKKPNEMKETMRALFRVFQLGDEASGNDYPSLRHPTGWSGEIGDGPKTAYDCLPPKRYVAPEKEVKVEAQETSEVKMSYDSTAKALFRVFQLGDKASGNDYPALSKPTGWAGEVGGGPKTAYDCLPPKPYNKNLSP